MFTKLSDNQILQKVDFITNYIKSENAATASVVDSNANVSNKNLATLQGEIYKDFSIQIRRKIMFDKIEELFDKETAQSYINDIKNHYIYQNDETGLLLPYCVSISMYPFLTGGLIKLGGESKAPNHLESFCGGFVNLVFAVSSQFSGAVSTPEFLTYFDYFCRKDYGVDYINTDLKRVENHLQHCVYALNQPAAARGYQSVFWNIAIFDKYYFESLFSDFVFPDGTKPEWSTVRLLQNLFMSWFNKERTTSLLTFPVVTCNTLIENNSPKDKDTMEMMSRELSEGNSFFIYQSDSVDSLSSCCRLRNELVDNTFSYTLGAGGISTGSINVITINLNRVIQRGVDLKEQVRRIHKYHYAFRCILKDLQNQGMMPVYDAGFISLKKQFSTIGINGMVEAAEYLGIEAGVNDKYKAFVNEILEEINNLNKEAKSIYKCMYNTEFVPGESLGVKNAKWDKKDGLKLKRDCYNSYFYAVEDDINAVDKFILHGRDYIKYLDGGSALHLNLEEHPSQDGYKKILELSAKTGCNYFTTNVKITICNDCGDIDKRTLTECNKCGSKNIDYGTRIIGYLKRISSFGKDRKFEAAKRFYGK